MEDIGGLFQGLYGMSTLSGMTSPTVRSSVTFVPAVVKLRIALYSNDIEYVTRCLCRCTNEEHKRQVDREEHGWESGGENAQEGKGCL
jgi:hypothetical protein